MLPTGFAVESHSNRSTISDMIYSRERILTIRKVSQENASDWFDFFDNRAFADHSDWKGCYCTSPFMPRLEGYSGTSRKRRDYAEWLIQTGRMNGYLAYEDNKAIGWCNVNARSALPMYAKDANADAGVLSIACFTVEKGYRRRGVATELLKRIIEDAMQSGIAVIEAYPRKRATTEFGRFVGPYEMYKRLGFQDEVTEGRPAVRKYLHR